MLTLNTQRRATEPMKHNSKLSLAATKPPVEKALTETLGTGCVLLFCPKSNQDWVLEKATHLGPNLRVNETNTPLEEINLVLHHRYDALPEDMQLQLVAAKGSGIRVVSLMDYFDQRLGFTEIELLSPAYFMEGRRVLGGALQQAIKRLQDITSASLLLILTTPILAAAATAIKLDSKGPIFFKQTRTGKFGTNFNVIKFRSMTIDAEKNGPQWAQKDDPRVTRIGRLMRLTRIDELPQLINVLRGEMSLIGPRPERPVFINELEREIPYYDFRHSIKPGITGYAQVKYPYGASVGDSKWKHRYDLYYIKHQSPWLDLKIMLMTIKIIFFGMGR